MDNIVWIIKNGQLDELKKLNFNCNAVLDTKGQCPIHIAADFNQIHVIEYLITNGADVNKANNYGHTPLLLAIFENQLQAVRLLLKAGASCNRKFKDSWYADLAESDQIKTLLKEYLNN